MPEKLIKLLKLERETQFVAFPPNFDVFFKSCYALVLDLFRARNDFSKLCWLLIDLGIK